MPVPVAAAAAAGRICCHAVTTLAIEDVSDRACNYCLEDATSTSSPSNRQSTRPDSATITNEEDASAADANGNGRDNLRDSYLKKPPQIAPHALNTLGKSSTPLFARPNNYIAEEGSMKSEGEASVPDELMERRRLSIHPRMGSTAAIEVDYEESIATSMSSNRSLSTSHTTSNQPIHLVAPTAGYVNGNFSDGKVMDVAMPFKCYNLKFNLDSTLLAVTMNNGEGVAIYETRTFTLLTTIERLDTASCLDWVFDPFSDGDSTTALNDSQRFYKKPSNRSFRSNATPPNTHTQQHLLAIGGFDGSISIYSISIESLQKGIVPEIVYDVRVKTAVFSLSFIQTNHPSLYVPQPLGLVIGEMSGRLSIFVTDGQSDPLRSNTGIKTLDIHNSAILSITFGFSEEGIVIAVGTRDGLVRTNIIHYFREEWRMSHLLFEHRRTGAVRAIKFNGDSTIMVIGGYDKRVAVVNVPLWKIVRELDVDGTVNAIEYDRSNKFMMLGTRSKALIIYDTSTYQPIKTIRTSGWVTSISWGGDSMVAFRSDDKLISFVELESIHSMGLSLESSRGEDCSISWTNDGRFLARADGADVVVLDTREGFSEIRPQFGGAGIVKGIRFCVAKNNRDSLAVIRKDGQLEVYHLRTSLGNTHVDLVKSMFVEENLAAVTWSTDGSNILCGGKSGCLHVICSSTYSPVRDPIQVGGRVRYIDTLSEETHEEIGDYANSFGIAISTGENVARIIDMKSFELTMEVSRKRTVRCVRYHPSLPVLAIGDGGNNIIIVDLLAERKVAEFTVGGRVNSIDFSPAGDFICVGSDDGSFTLHDTETLKAVQSIPSTGFASLVSFSGKNGCFLAVSDSDGITEIIKLGPLLSIDFLSPSKKQIIESLPDWAFNEIIYRSPQGPSFLQRCMLHSSQDSLMCAAKILKDAPESLLTHDRVTGVGCFETAVELRKPNVMKLIMTTLVDGTLEERSEWSNSVLTTTMPVDGILTLRDLILHHPQEYATDILQKMTFIKVPFTNPRRRLLSDIKECGSMDFADPWGKESLESSTSNAKRGIGMTKDNRDEVVLVPAVLPLPGMGTLEFLTSLVTNMSPGVFDNEAMGLVLRVMWKSVRFYFLIDFILNVGFFICWIFLVDETSASTSAPSAHRWTKTSLVWTATTLNSIFLGELIVKLFGRHRMFFRSLWHVVDVLSIIMVYAYVSDLWINNDTHGLFLIENDTVDGNVDLAVITTLLLTSRIVSLLRGFDRTGWLVSVLTQNFLDVRGFVIVLVAILLGFTVAFRLLFASVAGGCHVYMEDDNLVNDCDDDPFGTLARSLLSTFELTIIGSYDPGILYETKGSILASLVFVLAVTVVLVVALNALIAVLGDSFSRVQENVTANRRRERAEMIVEYLSMMPNRHRDRIEKNNQYFHALFESDGHGDLLLKKEDWQGGLNALKRELIEMNEASSESTQQLVETLRTELLEEIGTMLKDDVTSMLNDIFMEVKDLHQIRGGNGRNGPFRRRRNQTAATAVQAVQMLGKNLQPFDGIRKNLLPGGSKKDVTEDDKSKSDNHGAENDK